jgi:hypothetical protein
MRFATILALVFLCAFQGQATSTVNGFSVAPRNVGSFDSWGCFGKLMKYTITNGVTTNTSVLFDGWAHMAAINPDGRRIAFFVEAHKSFLDGVGTYGGNIPASIVVMSASGGALDTIVTGFADGMQRTSLDWPIGDWIYYGQGDTSTDVSYNGHYWAFGISELWKANVVTKQKIKICSFSNYHDSIAKVYQVAISNDGLKCAVRPMTDPISDGMFAFPFSDFPGGVVKMVRGDAHDYSWYGCGVAISPSGNHVMHINNGQHTQIIIGDWNHTYGNDPNGGTTGISLFLGTINSWRTPGTPAICDTIAGGGTDGNRWSCNDDKWICLCVGWRGRSADGGSNQLLVNWVDHEVVRTSNDAEAAPGSTNICSETGDFWVGNPTPTTAVKPPVASAAVVRTKDNSIKVFDMLGRQVISNAPLKRGVYFVQVRSANTIKTQKLVVRKAN